MAVVVLDASVLIAFLDPSDAHHRQAVAVFAAHQADELVLPASVYADVLVGPLRHGPEAVAKLEQFVTEFAIRIEPITPEIARQGALLRSRSPGLKLPDAFVLATAEALDASVVLTADRRWPKISPRVELIQAAAES